MFNPQSRPGLRGGGRGIVRKQNYTAEEKDEGRPSVLNVGG